MGFLIEFVFDSVLEIWVELTTMFIPEEKLKPVHFLLLQAAAILFSGILLFVFLFGVIVVATTEVTLEEFWAPVFIPLGISVLQIAVGICLRVSSRRKNKKS